jgi:hypothetical protein
MAAIASAICRQAASSASPVPLGDPGERARQLASGKA